MADEDVEVRLRMSLPEARALRRLLLGSRVEPGDNRLLDRVDMHVGAVIGTVERNVLSDPRERIAP